MTKVSVIVAVYNEEKYIEECLNSLIKQTLKEIEIICVDDGSTDSTLSIIKRYKMLDSRISIYTQKNQYAGVARNYGMEHASGRYLVFLDGDDYFAPDFLEKMYENAEKYHSEVVMCNIYHHNMSDGIVSKRNKKCEIYSLPENHSCMRGDEVSDVLFQLANGWAWDKMFLKSFVEEHKLKFANSKTANDGYFTYMAMALANHITKIDDYLVTQRINLPQSLSRNRDDSWKSGIKMLWDIRDGLIDYGIYDRLKISYMKFSMMYLTWACDNLKNISSRAEMACDIRSKVEPELKILDYISYFYDEEKVCDGYINIVTGRKRKNMAKVSVIIPVYNEEKYLEECISSVCNQTLKDIEIICVDDGSTDKSVEILDNYAILDERIRVIHKVNTGYGNSMNCGLQIATGDYIGIVESDDYIPDNMMQTLYEAAIMYDVDFVKSDFYRFVTQSDGKIRKIYNHLAPHDKYYNRAFKPMDEPLSFRFIMNIWSGIYKRSFIEDNMISFNETPGASFQDNGFWFKTFSLANRAVFLNTPLYMNRRDNPLSSVNNKSKIYVAFEEYDQIRDWVKTQPERDYKRLIYLCNEARIRNCLFTIYRIADEYKKEFYIRFSNDYKELLKRGEVAYSLFSDQWKIRLDAILSDPVKAYEDELVERKKYYDIIDPYQDVLIYGVGNYGRRLYRKLVDLGAKNRIAYFVVSDPQKNPKVYDDIPVIGLDDVGIELAHDAITIVAVSDKYSGEIIKILDSRKINYIYNNELFI